MQGRSSAVFCFVILICLLPSNAYAEDSVGMISSSESTYNYEEYYGVLLSPLRAIDGNTSDDNYTRIITWCLYYESNLACESGESFIRLEYTLSFTQEIGYVNLTTISKTGYLSYGDPWGLEMSISVFHENGTDVLWEDNETPGYINYSTWQQNNSGPIPVRSNGTIGVEFYIKTDPFYVTERDVEIRLNEIIASPVIWGCKDVNANNYSPNATDDDDSCDYDLDDDGILDIDEINGCTDSIANNFSPDATDDDGTCDYDLDDDGVPDLDEVEGCTDSIANNYSPNATDDDDSCDYDLDDDGILDIDEINGCTDSIANNFSPDATDDDGTCDYDLDDDGVPDALDKFSYCDDNGTDKDGDEIPDACDEFTNDKDNDGASDMYENHCGTNPEDNSSIPKYQYEFCGELGYVDLASYCLDTGNGEGCVNLVTRNLGAWDIVGFFTGGSLLLWFFTPLGRYIRSRLKKKELSEIEMMHKETREYIQEAFRELESQLSASSVMDIGTPKSVEKVKRELEDLAFDLKKYIDSKHTRDLLDEKIPGDPRIQLKLHVDDSKNYTLNQLLNSSLSSEEE